MNRSEYGHQLRVSLVEALAPDGRCARCGAQFPIEELEVDHADGRAWYGRALNFLDRIRRQWREFDRGVRLRAACRHCNASEGSRRFRGQPRYAR
jgi:DNA-directed RNA polymerase subunit RPC12/RpoP